MTQQTSSFAAKPEKKYGVWHGALSGRFYAGWAKRVDPEKDLWEQTGVRHDVTESVEAYIAQATARLRDGLETIGTHCTSYTGKSTCVENRPDGRGAKYQADAWCEGCIAREALR